jgi:inositol-phosphate phosphatase/L-galactose 1-phosphate phosphatase/histidinol-phosphatase
MLTQKHTRELIAFSQKVADAIGEIHRKYYRQPVSTEYKEDSSPVTQVDKESEMLMREMVMQQYPHHGILGEEYPPYQADAEFVWVIDPVDGTKYFMTGHPTFALLLGLAWKRKFILGVIDQAISRERWLGADGYGSFLNGKAITTRKCTELKKTILARPGFEWHTEGRDQYIDRLWQATHWAQWGVAPYDYGLLAAGHIDVVINAGPQVHDFAALGPVINNAGGSITDWAGNCLTLDSPDHIIAVGNADLLPEIIQLLGYQE